MLPSMGFAKSFIGREHMLLDEKVCHKCINHDDIKKLIKDQGKHKGCSYCSSKCISHDLSIVIDHIIDCIHSEYEDPVEQMSWDGREGGYQGATVFDSYDLLDEVGLEIENEDLRDVIISHLPSEQWCQKDPYQLPPDEELIYGWRKFSDLVKFKCRYMFLEHEKTEQERSLDLVLTSSILKTLKSLFEEHDMISTLPIGTVITRARHFNKDKPFPLNLKNSCPPLPGEAKSSRMSPAGISMLYAACDTKTALAEIGATPGNEVVIAKFKTLKEMPIIDLTKIPDVPSIFASPDHRFSRAETIFLNHFLADFSKPISKDGMEHIEYVPTQVVAEYCKYNVLLEKMPLMGFAYPSSVNEGGISYCFFLSRKECGLKEGLFFKKEDQKIELIRRSLKKVLVK